jgi:rhamnosyl/mannosyltransferase
MKRLLQISNYLYPNIGGIEQVARDIANVVAEEGIFEQKILCFNETARDGEYICNRSETVHDRVDGIEVIRCGCITKKFSQSISLTFPRELKNVMDDFDPDIVIFHYPNPFEAQFLQKYFKKKFKFVLYWHLDIVKQKLLGKLFYRQTMRLLDRADAVVATSPLYIAGSPFLSKYKRKCRVIPNCISENRLVVTDKIEQKAKSIRTENKNKIICFGIGRHIPYKGFKYLVEASKHLDDRFRIFIGGRGELTEKLKAQAAGDNKITFLGRVSDEDLIAYYLAMDIFCFPSITKNEAFGIALAEGMYFGKPAVTFHIPGSGVNYVNLKDVTGIEVPNGDCWLYAEAIRKLAEDKILRKKMGLEAKSRVDEFFTMKSFRWKILTMIQTL